MSVVPGKESLQDWINDSALHDLENWVTEPVAAETLMSVTTTMPEGFAILDCGAALDCIGMTAVAKTAQAIEAHGDSRLPVTVEKKQTFKFGGDGTPKEAEFAVNLPVTIGIHKT